MATLADVENTIVGTIAAALFPGTTYAPLSYAASVPAGLTIKLYRGWPDADTLNKDLAAGKAHVSVFPDNITRLMTRYLTGWEPATPAAVPSLTVAVSGRTATFGGAASTGQAAGIALGDAPYLATYAYRPVAGDTPASVAAAFAALIPRAGAAGAVLTLSGTLPVTALVVADQTATLEVRRQQQQIRVSVWCPDPHSRDTVASLADGEFAGMLDVQGGPTEFLALPDGTAARVRYQRSYTDDKPSRDTVWRRDLCYVAEYPTILTAVQPAMLFGQMTINAGVELTAAI
jgi:hypothetical protein